MPTSLRVGYAVLTLALLTSYVQAQQKTSTRQRQRAVVVNVKNGTPVSGFLVRIDQDALLLEIENARQLTVKLDEVSSIVFSTPAEKASTRTAQSSAVKNAIDALRSLAAATDVGINNRDYGNRVIEVKIIVDPTLAEISEGELKKEIKAALDMYIAASQFWDLSNSMSRDLTHLSRADRQQNNQKRDELLSEIWVQAAKHLDRANTLFAQSEK